MQELSPGPRPGTGRFETGGPAPGPRAARQAEIDALFAFVRRTAKGQGFSAPDKDHIHHRLLRLGHGHRRTVAILWLWTAVLSGFILYPLIRPKANPFVPFGALVLGVGLYTWFHPGLRRNGMDDFSDPVDTAPEGQKEVPVRFGVDGQEV